MKLLDYRNWQQPDFTVSDISTLEYPALVIPKNEVIPKRPGSSPIPSVMSPDTQYQRSIPYFLLPPNQEEMYFYGKRYRWLPILSSLCSFIGLCLSQIRLASMDAWLWWIFPFLLFTILYYLVSLSVDIFTPDFSIQNHRAIIEQWKSDRTNDGMWPSVDILLPICGEPVVVLKNTWKLVLEMCKSYPGQCTVYILDDGNSHQAQIAAQAFATMGFQYIVRPNRGQMKKAGNLKHGFGISQSEYIVVLDADFCPHRTMLFHLLPYMWNDNRVGIVQSPQFFRTTTQQTWITRGASAVQELFYRYIQVCRNYHHGAICVGSCALYRRAALSSIGGPYQIEHSEDVWTGVMCYAQGWNLQYIPINVSAGLCPTEYTAFVRQQYRWCMGSLSLLRSKQFWQIRMPSMTRLCYISGFLYYCHTAIFTFVMPFIPIVLVAFLPQQVRWENYALLIPSFLYSFLVFPMWHKCNYRLDSGFIDAMAVKLVYGWAHAFTIFDMLRGRPLGWQPTGASGTRSNTHWHVNHIRIFLCTYGMITSTLWIGLSFWRIIQSSQPWNFLLVFAMGVFNLIIVLRASIGATE